MLKLLLICSVFVMTGVVTAQDTLREPPRGVQTHDVLLMMNIPTVLVGVLALVAAGEKSNQAEGFDRLLEAGPNDDIQKLRDDAASYRNQYRVVAGACVAYAAVSLTVYAVSSDKQKKQRVKGQPWWMPKEKAAGISMSIDL